MCKTLLVILLSGALFGVLAQSMLETSAAAAGGSVGGVAGKKVSDGMTKIFEKIDKQLPKPPDRDAQKSAVAADPNTPLLEVGPGVPKSSVEGCRRLERAAPAAAGSSRIGPQARSAAGSCCRRTAASRSRASSSAAGCTPPTI